MGLGEAEASCISDDGGIVLARGLDNDIALTHDIALYIHGKYALVDELVRMVRRCGYIKASGTKGLLAIQQLTDDARKLVGKLDEYEAKKTERRIYNGRTK